MAGISKCRSCNSTKLTDVISLGNQYLSDFRNDDEKPEEYPLDLVMCKDCTLVQLKSTTPPEKLYTSHYGYRSGINNTIQEDLKDVVQKVYAKVSLFPNDIAVDIGSNDSTLLRNYQSGIIKVGFDPVSKFKEFYKGDNLHFINNYFNKEDYFQMFPEKKAKVITAISCFYDLDDPQAFVKGLVEILDPEGTIVVQQNYLAGMIKQNAFDNIVHEHLEYYSLASLTHLFSRYGLEIYDAEISDINGGSFRVYARHMSTLKKMRIFEKKLNLGNIWTYHLFAMRVAQVKKKLRKFIIDAVKEGKTIYVYGASTRGNTLLQYCELDNTLIKAAVERNSDKWGKKIASLGIPIISEEQARKDRPDYMLVCPWFFADEFIKRESKYIQSGGALLFPLPELKVVDHENIGDYTVDKTRSA